MSKEVENQPEPMRGNGPMGGMKGLGGGKAKNFKKSMARLLLYMKAYWPALIVAIVFAIAGTVFAVFGPKIMKQMTEEIVSGTMPGGTFQFDKITEIGLILVGVYLLSAAFTFTQQFVLAGINAKVTRKLRTQISRKINRLPLSYFDKRSYGDVLSRVTNDVDTIGQTLNQSLSNLITSATTIIGIIVMMFTISWELTLVNIVSIPVSLALIMIVVSISQKYFRRQQQSLGEVNGHVEEIYSAHSVVKIFNGGDKALEKFDKINDSLANSAYKSQFFSGLMMPIMNFVGNLSYVFICVIGGTIALNNPLFIASILAFVSYVRSFNQSVAQIANVTGNLQSSAAAAERVFEFLDEPEQEDESEKNATIQDVKGEVRFEHVKFGYTPDKEIIHDFCCTVKPGQKVAIVGPTGAGKTTLVNLLMRFYETTGGKILIDGVPIDAMTRTYVRGLFGMVLQDAWLFEGTVRENLKFARPSAGEEDLINACKAAKVHHFIKSQPGGYDMIIDEETNLSQGQKQLITIARAMVENAPMLILDEATSSVDTRTEALIQQAMDNLTHGRTSFVIAHRLSTIKNADLILVMKDGDIIESGSHDELMQLDGFYSDLYNSQFADNA